MVFFKSEMMAFVKVGSEDQKQPQLMKLFSIFASNETQGKIMSARPHLVKLEQLNSLFGQEMNLDNYSSVQSSYSLS